MRCMEEYLVVQFNVNEIFSCFNKCIFSIKKKKRHLCWCPCFMWHILKKNVLPQASVSFISSKCALTHRGVAVSTDELSSGFYRELDFKMLMWEKRVGLTGRHKYSGARVTLWPNMKTGKGSQQVLPAPRGETIVRCPQGLQKLLLKDEKKKKNNSPLIHHPLWKETKGEKCGLTDVGIFWKPLMLFLLEKAPNCLIYTF